MKSPGRRKRSKSGSTDGAEQPDLPPIRDVDGAIVTRSANASDHVADAFYDSSARSTVTKGQHASTATIVSPHPREGYADALTLVVDSFAEAFSTTRRQKKIAAGPEPDWLLTFSADDIVRIRMNMATGRPLSADPAELAWELAEGLAYADRSPSLWNPEAELRFYDNLAWSMLHALQTTGNVFPIDLARLPNWRHPESSTAAALLFDLLPEQDGRVDTGRGWDCVIELAHSVVPQAVIDSYVEAKAASLNSAEQLKLADAHAVKRMVMMFFRSAAGIALLARAKADRIAASPPKERRTHGRVRDEILDFFLTFSIKMLGFPLLDTRLPGIDHDVRDGPAVRFLESLRTVLCRSLCLAGT
jgi:hypothetical protein